MGTKTGIEWTDATWNPIIGCSRVSEGCRNCYAEGIAGRFGQGKPTVYSGLTQIVNGRAVWTGKIAETKQLLQPLSWRQPKRVFVNSMSDLFHENVTDEQRDKIFAVMALCPQHTFQVLTKRPERMLAYLTYHFEVGHPGPRECVFGMVQQMPGYDREHPKWIRLAANAFNVRPLPNVWLGVSIENQAAADERIPLLLKTPAAVRFISAEPLLGPVDLTRIKWEKIGVIKQDYERLGVEAPTEMWSTNDALESRPADEWNKAKIGLDWVICGGESGAHARTMHPDWARSLRDQCHAAGVPFFFKQWGEWAPTTDPEIAKARGMIRLEDCMSYVGKKAAGALLDGREWKQFPGTRISTAEISEPTYRNGCPILQP
jgi:protein gp37